MGSHHNRVRIHISVQICAGLGAISPELGTACSTFESSLPDIIQYILTENLNPKEVCICIGSCEGECTLNPSNTTANTS